MLENKNALVFKKNFLFLSCVLSLSLIVVVGYPTPFKGWGHGRRPWSPRTVQLPRVWTRGCRETQSPKSERRKESIAGQCRMR